MSKHFDLNAVSCSFIGVIMKLLFSVLASLILSGCYSTSLTNDFSARSERFVSRAMTITGCPGEVAKSKTVTRSDARVTYRGGGRYGDEIDVYQSLEGKRINECITEVKK